MKRALAVLACLSGMLISAYCMAAATGTSSKGANPLRRDVKVIRMKRIEITPQKLAQYQHAKLDGRISHNRKYIYFTDKVVRLVVCSGPANDMLSFRIAGLRNPTISIPADSTLHVLFLNTDDDMFHNFALSLKRAPFPINIERQIWVGCPGLPHRESNQLHGAEMTFRLAPGRYTYLCTMRGHAHGGMYGTLEVR